MAAAETLRPAHLPTNASPRWLAALENLIAAASALRHAMIELEAATPDFLQEQTPQLVQRK